MLKDLGVKYVIIGHSERRQYFGETDFTVNKKVLAALEAGLHPIICVGETLDQRELGVTMELIALQVKSALAGVPAEKGPVRHRLWPVSVGHRHRQDRHRRAGGGGVHFHPLHDPPPVRRPHCPVRHRAVRWLYEARQRCGAAGSAGHRRRPHRRRRAGCRTSLLRSSTQPIRIKR